ncbi:Kef-type K+ transport system membrane component KefB [Rhodococcus fascians]|uniref:cation:proton antiporter n=1 Tax=Nocardiaceae TaxID=85025 RepID=UPI00285A297F|nr:MULTISPECIES: cation:proton antiporter [Rhodococcus]MDR6909177.1 Kef-type K+ transport system membrane component KefB [Rhodococcus sp. 3258]MDR6930006.1 Kef-type K+ transport system membrane component KefB [Rhodococcus fascians]
MTFETLALCAAVGLFGPLLALPRGLRIPVVIGELVAGIVIGHTGFGVIDPSEQTLSLLAQVGFALVMFVAGSQVPIRDPRLRVGLRVGAARAVAVGLLATALGWAVSTAFDPPHPGLYAVLMTSSSAAVIMPIVESSKTATSGLMSFLPQIAIADAVCIVALPLVIDPPRAVPAAFGSITVIAAATAIFFVLRHFDLTGLRRRIHHVSAQRKFALELRLNLVLLFGLAALAVHTHASVMLAGFGFGLAIAAIGEPRRLAKQLFAITEGFLGPLYFVWLGASLDLRALGGHPSMIVLGLVLGLGAIAVHGAMRATGQPVGLGILAAAQLGVPVSAVTLGEQSSVLAPGEGPAIVLGALVTIAAAAVISRSAARRPA